MTASESKGRFFTERIDSHNRKLECSSADSIALNRFSLEHNWSVLESCGFVSLVYDTR